MGYMDLALSYSNQMRIVEAPASGGGLSQNSKFSYGYASSAGKRSSMEDFFETRIDGVDGEIVGLFGVFDGHGGARAAEYVKHHLFSNLITHPKFISDTKSAIADAYNHTDSELLKSENNHGRDAGSTASTAILVGDRLLVANVGDSRAVICRGGNAIAVSRDHKPDQSDERERIENAGGFVMWAGTWRVGGVLAVSRAFGDRLLKQYVVADPEIQEEKIDDSLEFLILASDGLWDVFSNEEAVAMVKEVEEPEESSKKLVGEAIRRGSADNITCVVVRFLESKNSNKVPNISSSSSTELNPCKPQDLTSPVETNKAQIKINNDSNIEANKGVVTVRKDSNNKNSAKKTSESGHSSSAKANTVTQKPVSAATKEVSSGQSGLTGQTKPVRSSSDKKPNQGQIAADNKLGSSSSNKKLNQKTVAASSGSNQSSSASVATKQVIAAAQTSGSLEQSGSVGEKNQKPVAVPSISN